ncbi:MAG: ABC-type lipoprotein release transport system permease subunit, partial [Myxococcota bacterium]
MSVLIRIALRNLRVHWVRTLIVGVLLILGTFLVVFGSGMMQAVQAGMRHSIIDSVAGHVQVYSSDAVDRLELYGSIAMGTPDIGEVDDFSVVRDALMARPEVKAVVPMGVNRSIVTGTSILDAKLQELRRAVEASDKVTVAGLVDHLRRIIAGLEDELAKLDVVSVEDEESAQRRADLAKVQDPAFWTGFVANPQEALEFLENRIAPLGVGSGIYLFQFIGTDPQAYAKHFDLFEVVEGEIIPPGQRGFLINVFNHERFLKHKTARRLDTIQRARDDEGRWIDEDDELQQMVAKTAKQARIVTDELGPRDAEEVASLLRAELPGEAADADVETLMVAFLTVNDANFDARLAFFYAHIAPRIRLYRYNVGDTLTLYGQSRSGYIRAINVKIWGTFRFKGLEKATLAGSHHIMDLVTFRELYGLTNAVTPEEVAALKAKSGIETVSREEAEDALFGDDSELVADDSGESFDAVGDANIVGKRTEAEAQMLAGFTQADIDNGPILNAAVFLHDDKDLEQQIAGLQGYVDAKNLGLTAISWNAASGLVGQLTTAMDILFYASIVIIFLTALLIIIVSLVMSAKERVQEIGTMRAIGAQRGFVVRMFVVESAVMALIFGS